MTKLIFYEEVMFIIKALLILGLSVGIASLTLAETKKTKMEVKASPGAKKSIKNGDSKLDQQQSNNAKKKPNMAEYCRKYTC